MYDRIETKMDMPNTQVECTILTSELNIVYLSLMSYIDLTLYLNVVNLTQGSTYRFKVKVQNGC